MYETFILFGSWLYHIAHFRKKKIIVKFNQFPFT